MADVTVTSDVDTFMQSADKAEMRTNIGAGTIATQNANNVSITGGSITGITDLAVADGGTGAGTASGARTNLEVYSDAEVDAKVATKATAGGIEFALNSGTIQYAPCLPTTHFTDSAWFYVTPSTASVSTGWLLGDGNTSSDKKIILSTFSNTFRLLASTDGTNWTTNVNTNVQIPVDRWFHLSIVYTPSTSIELFIDGVSVYNNTTSIPASLHNSATGMVQNTLLYAFRDQLKVRYRRVFNRALSAAEVADLYESGTVAVADRWGNPEYYPNYTASDYLDGTIFNISVYPTLVTGLSDPDSGTNAFSLENPDTTQRRFGTDANEVISTKQKVALSFWARVPSGTYNLSVLFRDNPFTSVVAHTAALTTSWQKFTFTDSSVRANAGFYFDFTTAVTVEIYDLKFYSVGCIADLPLDEGIGYQFHDRSSNHFDALASTSGVTHLVPKTEGYIRDFNVDAYNGGTGAFIVTSAQQMLPENAMWSDFVIEDNIGGTNFSGSAFYASDGTIGSNLLICSPTGITGAGSKILSVPPSNVGITPSRNRLFLKVTDSTPDPASLNIRAEYKQI